jgi:hypothetical protein
MFIPRPRLPQRPIHILHPLYRHNFSPSVRAHLGRSTRIIPVNFFNTARQHVSLVIFSLWLTSRPKTDALRPLVEDS